MDRMLPTEALEPGVPDSGGASALRTTLYTVLAIMLVAGVWVRFNSQIAAVAPALATGPAAAVADQLPGADRVRELLDTGLVPIGETQAAIAAMGLSAADAALLTTEVERRRVRLVHLPVLDITPVLPADEAGHDVVISAAGYTRAVHLTRQVTTVTLPISVAGVVTFRSLSADPVRVGALTLTGLAGLPDLASGQQITLGLVAE
jgi:hypothetical protein